MLSQREVARILSNLSAKHRQIASLIYGGGLRLRECLLPRQGDIDFDRYCITVRDGKGGKDRQTILPENLIDDLRRHIEQVRLSTSWIEGTMWLGVAALCTPAQVSPYREGVDLVPGVGHDLWQLALVPRNIVIGSPIIAAEQKQRGCASSIHAPKHFVILEFEGKLPTILPALPCE